MKAFTNKIFQIFESKSEKSKLSIPVKWKKGKRGSKKKVLINPTNPKNSMVSTLSSLGIFFFKSTVYKP